MSAVKRFDTGTDNTHYYGVPVMEECEDGDYVLSADYDALKAERDQLRAELAAIRASEPVCDSYRMAVDTALVCAHLGVTYPNDSYETAAYKLNELICWSVQVDRDLSTTPQPQPDVQALVESLRSSLSQPAEQHVSTLDQKSNGV